MKVTYGAIVQSASGRFGGTVHSNWKGVQVVRRFAKPSNPNSVDQQDVRSAFRALTTVYLLMPSTTKAAWTSWAVGKPLIARNKLIGDNVPLIAGDADFLSFLPTPGDASTLPPAAFASTGGAGQITTTFTAPSIPTGWAINAAVACVISSQADPQNPANDAADLTMYEGTDGTAPYAPTVSGLAAGQYYTWGFLSWLAPDGSTRYSAPVAGGIKTVT